MSSSGVWNAKNPMDVQVEQFYRTIYADCSVDRDEATDLNDFLSQLNPPPDKVLWLRSTAFKIGCEFLSDSDNNESLLRTINYVVHAIEQNCLEPKEELGDSEEIDYDKVEEYYAAVFDDLSVDHDESEELYEFFRQLTPRSSDDLIQLRALAFKVASNKLSDSKDDNTNLLRCVNAVVHAFEYTWLKPKPYHLKIGSGNSGTSAAGNGNDNDDVDYASMSLNEAVQYLWDLDSNRLEPGVDYICNVQRGKKPYWKEDNATEPLFTSVDSRIFKHRPTYKTFAALLDNYVAETGVAENVSDVERREVQDFLNAIMETAPMQFCHRYCVAHSNKKVPSDRDGFVNLLRDIWFGLYSRRRGDRPDSSGFEHVFVGEVKDGDVSGFHNWIQLWKEEKLGKIDYRGYIRPRGRDEAQHDCNDHLLTIQFRWNGIEKFVGTSFVGVSPEFEMALYTMCFLIGETEENDVVLDTGDDKYELKIKCYRMSRDKIGTAFPEVTSHYEE